MLPFGSTTLENSLNAQNVPLRDEGFVAYCRPLVLAYLEKRDWQLIKEMDVFIEEVVVEARQRLLAVQRAPEKVVEDATIYCYGRQWATLCRAEGTLRQREALLAVGQFFNRVIRPFLAAIAPEMYRDEPFIADGVQQSVIEVWRSLSTLRDEGAFVYWLQQILRRTVWRLVVADERYRALPMLAAIGQERTTIVEASFALPIPIETGMTKPEIKTVLKHCLRSPVRRYVIIAIYVEHKTIGQVAAELNLTARDISQYKAKALHQLRNCTELVRYLRDLLM